MQTPKTPPGAVTVSPSRPGVFAPASFRNHFDAWDYAYAMQAETMLRGAPCGIHIQTAYSFRVTLGGDAA